MNEILEKAKKLLALRDRAGTRAESEAAARALSKMLDKYRITMAELETQSGAAEPIVADDKSPLIEWIHGTAWRQALIDTLCRHYGVASWRVKRLNGFTRSGRKQYTCAVYLCGRTSDVALVRHLFAWLSTELTRVGSTECAGRGFSFKNSWMFGFVEGIDKQLSEARSEVVKEVGDVALALSTRADESARVMKEQVEGLSTNKHMVRYKPKAYAAGQLRGESHHLGQKLDTGHVRALPEAM